MGLDITAYGGLSRATGDIETEEGGYPKEWDRYFYSGHFNPEQVKHWPGRGDPIEPNTIYNFESRMSFRAGSYGGYNEWRSWLARVAGFKNDNDYWANAKPEDDFYELINFSDCEGVIGSIVAAELVKDFEKHAEKAAEMFDGCYYREMYDIWHKACQLAANNGAIDFH